MKNDIDYVEAVMAVKALTESRGWQIYCAEFEARFIALTNTILDGKTDGITAEHLRQARCRIEQEFTPAIIASQLSAKTGKRAEAQLRVSNGLPEKPS